MTREPSESGGGQVDIEAGQRWRHRRQSYRVVTVVEVDGDAVHVTRNTSRRRQPISRSTLLRDYARHV